MYLKGISTRRVDKIRGVDSTGSIQTLLERKLIETAGKESGVPLYCTTSQFLHHFGLKSLQELQTTQ